MSNSHLFLPSGFIKAPLMNGIGRFVPQLQRVTIKFCKSHGDSHGVRQFVESDLLDFAKHNPSVVVYLKPRRHRSPVAVAEYLNGERDSLSLKNMSREEVLKWLEYIRGKTGFPIIRFRKSQHTDFPTIQGVWTPFTYQSPERNLDNYPSEEFSKPLVIPQSATEQLLEIFERSQQSGVNLHDTRAE
nr:EOG090X0FS9 [Triops cancriformis]